MSKKVVYDAENSSDNAIKQRLFDVKSHKFNGSNTEMAEILGVTPSELSHIINGTRGIGLKIIKLVGDNMKDISLTWLITGRGEMTIRDDKYVNSIEKEQIEKLKSEIDRANQYIETLRDNIILLKEKMQWDEKKN